MERIEGLSIGLDLDSIKVDSGLKSLNSKLKLVNSEMKANMSAFDKGDKSIEKYETRLSGLNKKLEVQRAMTDSALKSYEKMVKEHGEGSKEAEKAASEYNKQAAALKNLERYVDGVKDELSNLKEEQRIANSNWTKFGNKLDEAGSKMKTFGDNSKDVGSVLSKGLTAPILAFGTAAGVVATNFDSSTVKMRNSLGLTAKEAKELTSISRDIYKKGFGESAEDIERALIQTRQNIKDLNKEDLGRITQKAYLLAETFEADVNEVTRAGNNLMKGFGIEADEAFDLMAHGAQNGLNFSNEMFDNLSEYSTLFASMGYSAEEYFELLQKGTEAGVYNLDYINDVMKEFQIRVKDGSTATSDAMSLLSKDTRDVWKEFLKGNKTVKDVSNKVLKELKGMDDQVKANEIGVALYGTKWEDLESEAMYALGGIEGGLKDVDGTMDEMTKNAEQSISQQWKSIWREAKAVVLPLGQELLVFAKDILPDVKEGVKDVSEWFSNLDEQGKKNILVLGGIAAAAGPVLTVFGHLATGTGTLIQLAGGLTKAIGVSGGKGTAGALSLLSKGGVAGLAVAGIAAVSLTVADLIRDSKKAKEVNLELAESLADQANQLNNSADTFDKLSQKAKISNEQLAELNDLNIRISESSNPGEIEELQKQYDILAKNSGLSKDELKRLFDANKDIIEQAPNAKKSISEYGNAFVENTDAAREYINTLYEASLVELKAERVKQLEREKELMADLEKDIKKRNTLERELQYFLDGQKMTQDEIWDRQEEINDLIYHSKLSEEERNELMREHGALQDALTGDIVKEIEKRKEKLEEQKKSVETTQKELDKINALDIEMTNIILKQVGINAEGEKGLIQLDEALAKNQQELNALDEKLAKNGKLTEEEQERYKKLSETVDKQIEAKEYLNEELGVYANINSLVNTKLNNLSKEKQQKVDNLAETIKIKNTEADIVKQIELKNEKLLEERANLEENRKKQGANKEEIDKQIAAIDKKIYKNDEVLVQILKEVGIWDDVKDTISLSTDKLKGQGKQQDDNNKKAAQGLETEIKRTVEAAKDVIKKVTVTDNGTLAKLNERASKPLNKVINFIGKGLESLKFWAKGTPPTGHPGGLAVVGERGSELITTPSGRSFLSPPSDTLLDLPKGSHVIPHEKTKRLLKFAPRYAKGTPNWENLFSMENANEFMKLLALIGKGNDNPSNGSSGDEMKELILLMKELIKGIGNQQNINPAPVILEGEKVGEIIFNRLDQKNVDDYQMRMFMNGGNT